MRKIIISLFLCMALLSTAVAAANYIVLTIEFKIDKQDKVELKDVRLYEGKESLEIKEQGDYSIVLLSSGGDVLHTAYFEPEFTAWALDEEGFPFMPDQENATGGLGQVERDEIEVLMRIPYYDNAAKFQIKKGVSVLYEGDAKLCNDDGTCQPNDGENYLSCFTDCPSGSQDDYCDAAFDSVCDPDCEAQGRKEKDTDCTCGNGVCDPREDGYYCAQDCGATLNTTLIMLIGGPVVLIIIIIVVIVLVVKRRRKK